MVVLHWDFSIVVLLLCNLVVDPSFSQTTGGEVEPAEYEAGLTTTIDYGHYGGPTTIGELTTVGGEVEVELEAVVSTTTAKPIPKPKRKTTPAPVVKTTVMKTTAARATVKPLVATTVAAVANATTAAKEGQESILATNNVSKATTKQAETSPTTKAPDPILTTQPVTTTTTTTQRPVVKIASRTQDPSIMRNMLTGGHTCPKMDVATWENEVVIYDNNCAIIIRMNPQLRRPTVTFQAPYW